MVDVRLGSDSTMRCAFGLAAVPSRGDIYQWSSAEFGKALVNVRFSESPPFGRDTCMAAGDIGVR